MDINGRILDVDAERGDTPLIAGHFVALPMLVAQLGRGGWEVFRAYRKAQKGTALVAPTDVASSTPK